MIRVAGSALFCLLLLSACSFGNGSDHAQLGYQVLKKSEVHASTHSNRPPYASDQWESIALPDSWDVRRAGMGGDQWYRFPITITEASSGTFAVLVPRLSMNASVWWDLHFVGDGGSMEEPMARNWHRPLYFKLPSSMLSEGKHWLYLHVHGYPHDGSGLGYVYIGKDKQLSAVFDKSYFLQVTLSVIALIMTLVTMFSLGTLWLLRRKQGEFFWIAIACFFWSIVLTNHVMINHAPLDHFSWEWAVQSSIGFYTVAILLVVHRLLQTSRPRIEIIAASYYLLSSAVVYLFAGDDIVNWFNFVHLGSILLGVYMIVCCGRHYFRTGQPKALSLGAGIAFSLTLGVHDWLVTINDQHLTTTFIMQFGPALLLLLIGGWMLSQFASGLEVQEKHDQLLNQKIDQAREELNLEYRKRIALEKSQTLFEERQRFTRELHDGVGGQLLALKSMLAMRPEKNCSMVEVLDQTILDMRLILDAVGDNCSDVGMTLGLVRSRLEHQLSHSGLSVSWNMISLPMNCDLQSGHSLHLIRILQEAITNVIRHAEADWVDVRATISQQHAGHVEIIVADNGKGLSEDITYGRGINNMRERTAILGGLFDITNEPVTAVHVIIPVSIAE